MKKIIIAISILLTNLISFIPAQAQKVLLDEDFNTNKNGWLTYIDKPNFIIYNGKLVFAVNDSLTYNVVMPISLSDAIDFSITATTTHTDGSNNHGYGIFFGSSDVNTYYGFVIAANGHYRFVKSSSTEYIEIIKWTTSTAIKTGNYVDNILQVSRKGTNWILSVNGQTLTTVPVAPFFGTKVGFSQTTMQRVEYDNVKVTQY